MSQESRYTSYSRKRLPREKKTTLLHGAWEDNGKFYNCWNCGFTVNSEVALTGGDYSGDGLVYEDFSEDNLDVVMSGDALASVSVVDDIGYEYVGMELALDGNPKQIKHTFDVTVSGGCPFCGSLNYK